MIAASETPPPANLRCLDSAALFAGSRMLVIRHEGEEYRLRITAAGKLILTK